MISYPLYTRAFVHNMYIILHQLESLHVKYTDILRIYYQTRKD
jgi:hypothetical protein